MTTCDLPPLLPVLDPFGNEAWAHGQHRIDYEKCKRIDIFGGPPTVWPADFLARNGSSDAAKPIASGSGASGGDTVRLGVPAVLDNVAAAATS